MSQYNSSLIPADEVLELALLGAIILEPQTIERLDYFEAKNFYFSRHQELFQKMRDNWDSGLPIDPVILSDGDPELMSLCTDAFASCPSPFLADEYAHSLRELSGKRGAILSLETAIQSFSNGDSLADLGQQLHTIGNNILAACVIDDGPEAPHPLDIEPQPDLRLGWIDEYADLITLLTGSPREFNVLAGLVVAATAIQRRARLRMSFGDIYCNIYACEIAPSSVYHKSSSLAKVRVMLQRAQLNHLLLPELFTPEGLLKQLQAKPAGLSLRDEIGTLFSSHNTRYLANLKPDLTALYDGYAYNRRLSNDDIKVPSPYLNIMGATTPTRFFEGVSYVDWQDGFLARWLFVMPEGEPTFDAMTGLITQEHDAQLGALATTLINIDRQRETDFAFGLGAFGLWDTWQRQAVKDAFYFGDDVAAAIVTRYAAYALKFAMILSIVNEGWGTITIDTMQTAIHLADTFKATVYRLISAKSNYGVSGAKLQKVFRIIKQKGGTAGLTQREISQLCNMKKSELTPCMEKLLSIGAIMTVRAVVSTRTERYIHAVENLPAKIW